MKTTMTPGNLHSLLCDLKAITSAPKAVIEVKTDEVCIDEKPDFWRLGPGNYSYLEQKYRGQ